ncbi:MAG: hypothetical protein A2W03_16550 [Candidatus Aminicenantes bacterium RBG_16_63_16]|nr:MAG: hypothetical protein A2W03_16550 [Candidatus Aminicenantes bacterium RBG_16_63_16]
MRKSIAILFVLLLAVSLTAQVRTGNIFGKVQDQQGNPLPGVTVTLISPFAAPLPTVTSTEGTFKFLSLPPAKDYAIELKLEGFKSKIEQGVVINVGINTNVTLSLEQGVLEEQVTVVAVSPMVDTKKTTVTTNITQDMLQSLPQSRDPFSVMAMAPSVITDRDNPAGSESGQQASSVARGSAGYTDNVWAMDGIVITDPSAAGASPSYYDFDAFEEMNVTVGGQDVTVQTGGIALNMVTRRAGNRTSLGGRFYLTDSYFQADTFLDKDGNVRQKWVTEKLVGINKINNVKDYGFNLGVPVIKDKVWIWASYGVQDIRTFTVFGTRDDTMLQNYVAKLNIQPIAQNRFEAFIHVGGKYKWGRSTSTSNPEGLFQAGRFHWGSPILKFQDEHMFGDSLFVSAKYAFSNAGFNLTPMTDLDFNKQAVYDWTAQRYYGSQATQYWVDRPNNQYSIMLNYFNDSLFGASHDIKVGFDASDRGAYTRSTWTGNTRFYQNPKDPYIDLNNDQKADVPPNTWKYLEVYRGYYRESMTRSYAGYAQDTLSFGRFNVILGLRWDYQRPRAEAVDVLAVEKDSPVWKTYYSTAVADKLDSLLPAIKLPKMMGTSWDGKPYRWNRWSPRVGVTWDMFGDGKTLAKLSGAQYGGFMDTGPASWYVPGGAAGQVSFWWLDAGSKDGKVDLNELYWLYRRNTAKLYTAYNAFDASGNFVGNLTDGSGYYYSGYDPLNPGKLTNPYGRIDNGAQDTRTQEAIFSLEREILTDFGGQLIFTYRKYDNFSWNLKYFQDAAGNPTNVQNQSWYVSGGNPVSDIPDTTTGMTTPLQNGWTDTKESAQHAYYYQNATTTAYSPYWWRQTRPDYYYDYLGFDIVLTKRLSNKWMMNANFTWQTQAQHYGDKGYVDPTNVWAWDGKPQAAELGGTSGKINQYAYSNWMFKISGLYQLPFGLDVSTTFNIRQGWIQTEYYTFTNYTLPNPANQSFTLQMMPFETYRLPNFYVWTLRAEKMIRIADTGRIYIMFDVFNTLNGDMVARRYQKTWGTYYYYGAGSSQNRFVNDTNYNLLNEILSPRCMRIGVRFQI